jgi:hypothetical protein
MCCSRTWQKHGQQHRRQLVAEMAAAVSINLMQQQQQQGRQG